MGWKPPEELSDLELTLRSKSLGFYVRETVQETSRRAVAQMFTNLIEAIYSTVPKPMETTALERALEDLLAK